jgi:hypothetical protein
VSRISCRRTFLWAGQFLGSGRRSLGGFAHLLDGIGGRLVAMAIGQHHVEHPPRSAVDVIRMFTHPCVILIAHPARSVMHDCQLRIEVSDLVLRSGEHHSPQTARLIVVTHEIGLLVACGTHGNQPRRKSAIPSVTVCGLKIRDIDLDQGLIHVAFNYVVKGGRKIRKDTKTYQDRWLAIDPDACVLIASYVEEVQAALAAVELAADAYLFFNDPGHIRPWNRDWATHRISAAADAVGVTSTSRAAANTASQLLAAGFDRRNTAARLGHSGGATTLRTTPIPYPRLTDAPQRTCPASRQMPPQRHIRAGNSSFFLQGHRPYWLNLRCYITRPIRSI